MLIPLAAWGLHVSIVPRASAALHSPPGIRLRELWCLFHHDLYAPPNTGVRRGSMWQGAPDTDRANRVGLLACPAWAFRWGHRGRVRHYAGPCTRDIGDRWGGGGTRRGSACVHDRQPARLRCGRGAACCAPARVVNATEWPEIPTEWRRGIRGRCRGDACVHGRGPACPRNGRGAACCAPTMPRRGPQPSPWQRTLPRIPGHHHPIVQIRRHTSYQPDAQDIWHPRLATQLFRTNHPYPTGS